MVGNELTIDIDVIISPITSGESRNEFDVPIEFWKEAGLIYQSVARTSKIGSIPKSAFIGKLGNMHLEDLNRILDQCRKLF